MSTSDAAQLEWQSFYDLIEGTPERVFLREVSNARRPLDYARLKSFIAQEIPLHTFGIGQGDRLCVVIPNGPEAAVCFLGMSLFCTYAPLSTKLTPSALQFEFEDLPAKAVVVMSGLDDDNEVLRVAKLCGDLPIIELSPSAHDVGLFTLQWRPGSKHIPALTVGRVWPTRNDVALVLHTSGTTNKPKVVPLSHGNIGCGGLCIKSTLGLKLEDVCINIMPLFHIHGISVNVLVTALSGSSLYATTGFAGGEAFFEALLASPQPTWYSAVPTMHIDILNYAEACVAKRGAAPPHKLEFARNCSASLLPSVAQRMEQVLDLEVLPTYAMTESMPIASNPRPRSKNVRKLRSVGLSGGPTILVLRDPPENTEVCDVDEEGHICVRGECVTKGYEVKDHMKADPNKTSFTADGFLCTGDKGFVDGDGHLNISGRFKEIINRGGEKISPMEVEDVLIRHPAISEMICFAAPHNFLIEVVGAAVVLHQGESLRVENLRSFGQKQGLNMIWLPETLVIMDQIPKGMTGKPARIGLAATLQLPEIKDGDVPTTWDVAEVPANKKRFPPAPLSVAREDSLIDDYLAIERSPAPSKIALEKMHDYWNARPVVPQGLGLDREAWASALLSYLVPALSNEVGRILGLPVEDIALDIPLYSCGFDSITLLRFQCRIFDVIGTKIPLSVRFCTWNSMQACVCVCVCVCAGVRACMISNTHIMPTYRISRVTAWKRSPTPL